MKYQYNRDKNFSLDKTELKSKLKYDVYENSRFCKNEDGDKNVNMFSVLDQNKQHSEGMLNSRHALEPLALRPVHTLLLLLGFVACCPCISICRGGGKITSVA